MSTIQVSDFTASYDVHGSSSIALQRVSLTFPSGRMHLILGRSGSGKSTLLYASGGLIPRIIRARVQGEVLLDGHSIERLSRKHLAAKIGFVFQNSDSYFATSCVESEIAFGLENLAVPRDDMIARVRQTLERMHLCGIASATLTRYTPKRRVSKKKREN